MIVIVFECAESWPKIKHTRETFRSADVTAPDDLAKLYTEYQEALQNMLGSQVARIVAVEIKSCGKVKNAICYVAHWQDAEYLIDC